jgi:hypothetical protein
MLVSIPAAFELKTQSVCLAGVDLPQLLPAAAALPSGLQLLPGLAEDVEAAREKAAEAAQEGDFAQQGEQQWMSAFQFLGFTMHLPVSTTVAIHLASTDN